MQQSFTKLHKDLVITTPYGKDLTPPKPMPNAKQTRPSPPSLHPPEDRRVERLPIEQAAELGHPALATTVVSTAVEPHTIASNSSEDKRAPLGLVVQACVLEPLRVQVRIIDAALLALFHFQRSLPLERKMPEPYCSTWTSMLDI